MKYPDHALCGEFERLPSGRRFHSLVYGKLTEVCVSARARARACVCVCVCELVASMTMSRLVYYCNATFAGVSDAQIARVETNVARLVLNKNEGYSCHTVF